MAHSDVIDPGGTGSYRIVRRQEVARLTLTEAHYSHEVLEPTHSHPQAYFEIVLQGGYTEQEKQRTLEYRALSVAFEPIKEPHSARIHPQGLHNLRIELCSEWLKRIGDGLDPPYVRTLDTAASFVNGALPALGVRLYSEWQRMDAVSSLTIEGLVLEMIAETIRCRTVTLKRTRPLWLDQAEDLLRAEFAGPLTLEYVAQVVGVHPIYLARAFRLHYRCTVGEYIRRLRVEYACKQIVNSDASLADIALAAGFADQSHFSKVFKHVVGLSPSAYRRSCLASPRSGKM